MPLIVKDLSADPRSQGEIERRIGVRRPRNVMAVPVWRVSSGGERAAVGVAQVVDKNEGHFTRFDLNLLDSMTRPAAQALMNARLRDENERMRNVTVKISRVMSASSGSLDVLLANLTATVARLLDAMRCAIFLYDEATDELCTRAASGSGRDAMREVRVPSDKGILGRVFQGGTGIMVLDAYAEEGFCEELDRTTGFKTHNIICCPIWKPSLDDGEERKAIGVAQAVNKIGGDFTNFDLHLLENMMPPAAQALANARLRDENERMKNILIDIAQAMSESQSLDLLLPRLASIVTRYLGVERCTIFLHNEKTGELYSRASENSNMKEIRFPSTAGIAGQAFTEEVRLVVPDAYADARFNQAIDRTTGFRTRDILAVPIWKNSTGGEVRRVIGVAQAVNKIQGEFTQFDLNLLENMTTQAAHALVSARLTEEVTRVKNYNERMLESIGDGILSVDPDERIVKVNRATARMLRLTDEGGRELIGRRVDDVFSGENAWIASGVHDVARTGNSGMFRDMKLQSCARSNGATVGPVSLEVNLTIVPLTDPTGEQIGCIVQIEDVTKEKKMRNTLSRYMSPKVAERMLEEGAEELGGSLHCATALFSDIRGFTSISERLGATKTVDMLNAYFSRMTKIVFDHNGSLDKFIGDAIMAVYGVPFESPDDADNAVRTAIRMQIELLEYNKSAEFRDLPDLRIGIGVNTGEVVSGNIGSMQRMEYTSIGDAVNLSARLEGASKTYGADILISEFTVDQLRGSYVLREVDRICVKGKSQPVAIYEVLDHLIESDPTIRETMPAFQRGLRAYRSGSFGEAIRCFSDVLERRPLDRASRLLYERCKSLAQNPPDKWDGVWEMKTK